MNEVLEELKKLDINERKEYISKRYEMLENISSKNDKYNNFHEGFINSKVRITLSPGLNLFYTMSGIDYEDLIDYVINKDSDFGVIVGATNAVRGFCGKEIENSKTVRVELLEKEIERLMLPNEDWFDFVERCGNDISIKIFKDKGVNRCLENAALLQNYLTFLGFDSYFLTLYDVIDQNAHALNVIKIRGENMIYDISYLTYDNYGYRPNVALISDEDLENLKNGGSFTFDACNLIYDGEGNKKIVKEEHKYILRNKIFQYYSNYYSNNKKI